MHYETLLFALVATVLLLLFMPPSARGQSPAFAIAGLPGLSFGQYLFEKVALLFEKEAQEWEAFKKEVKEGVVGLKGEMKGLVDEAMKGVTGGAKQEDIDALKKEYNEKAEKMQESIDDFLTKAARHEERTEPNRKSIMEQMEDGYEKLKKEQAENKKSMKDLPKIDGPDRDIDLKAVSNITSGYALTPTAATVLRGQTLEPGVAKDPTAPLFLTDIIGVGFISSNTLIWAERTLIEGGAGQTAEGAMAPQISVKWDTASAIAKKTMVYAKISEEMLEDTDFVASEVQEEIQTGPGSILVALENQMLTGDGTGENHLGLSTMATAFAAPAGFDKLANPNTYDALNAVLLQIVKANYVPTHVVVNPSTVTNMQLTKDANGNYILPPFLSMNGNVIAGVRVVGSNRMAEDAFIMFDAARPRLFLRREFTLKYFDQNQDDPLRDMRTVTGSVRGIFRVKGPDKKAVVKGTFAAVKLAIKTV